MSFVKKAVKKVFKFHKKILKGLKKVVKSKWFKIALLAALTVFTAGVAAGGFAAFAGVSSVGGFMTAVGTTMSTGWTAILGAVGIAGSAAPAAMVGTTANTVGVLAAGAGAAAPLTGTAGLLAGGATSIAASAGAAAGLGTAGAAAATAATGWSVATAGTGVGQSAGTTSFLGKVVGAFTDTGSTGTALRGAVGSMYQAHVRGKAEDKAEFYRRNTTIAGGAAFGGSDTYDHQTLSPYLNKESGEDLTNAGMMAQRGAFAPINATEDNKSKYLLGSSKQQEQAPGQMPAGLLAQADAAGRAPTQDPQQQQQNPQNKFLLENFGEYNA